MTAQATAVCHNTRRSTAMTVSDENVHSPGDSELAKNSSSSSADTDGDTDSSQAQTSADSDAAAVESNDGDEADPLSSTKRLQDLSEDDYEEPAEPRIDVDELVQ